MMMFSENQDGAHVVNVCFFFFIFASSIYILIVARGVNTFSPQGRLFQVDDEEFDIMTAGFDNHRDEDEGRGCSCRREAYHLTPLGMSLSMVLYTTLSKFMFLIACHDENGRL
ncbi:hypothetical protein Tco_0118425 [Tanacetum coccineum]